MKPKLVVPPHHHGDGVASVHGTLSLHNAEMRGACGVRAVSAHSGLGVIDLGDRTCT